jgi:glycine/D-amino acid oxidase-like deaminating enzyme
MPIVASRLCLYDDSFDGDFIIDRDPDRKGLIVAGGSSGHGAKVEKAEQKRSSRKKGRKK